MNGLYLQNEISETDMRIKVSAEKERCQFCNHNDLWEMEKLPSGRTRITCLCGYTWLKESWMEMMTRTGKVWAGHKYDSDHLEEEYGIRDNINQINKVL